MTTRVPIKHLFEVSRNMVMPNDYGNEPLFHYSLPAWHEHGDGIIENASDLASGKLLLQGGEVLVSKLNPEKSAVLLADEHDIPTVCSPEFIALVPKKIDRTFAYYFMLSAPLRHQLNASVESVTNSHKRARVDRFLASTVDLPDLTTQRQIADFLDRETARIDLLIEKKQRLVALLGDHWDRFSFDLFSLEGSTRFKLDKSEWQLQKLKFLSPQVTVGIVVTPAAYYTDRGVPAIRGTNIRAMELRLDEMVSITDEGHRINRKSAVTEGDVVVVRTGQPGTAAVVPKALDGANCIDVILIKKSKKYDSDLLAHFLNSSAAKAQYMSGSSGAIQQHFNISIASNLVVPVPPLREQGRVLAILRQERQRVTTLTSTLHTSINRLKEYRSALITAAVTGQIDVSAYAKSGTADRRLDAIQEEMGA